MFALGRVRWVWVAALMLALALVAAACADDDDDDLAAEEDPADVEEEEDEEEDEEEVVEEDPEPEEEFPTEPITILVGFGAGGANDLIARNIAPLMSDILGVDIAIENIPGGGGIVAMTEAVGEEADGYTLVTYQPPTPFISELLGELPFDRDEIMMIGANNVDPTVIAVPLDSPLETLSDLVEAAEEDELSVGHTGVTGMAGLSTLLFMREIGVDLTHVTYDSGGDQHAAVLGGHVETSVRAGGWYDDHEEELRVLAVMNDERIDEFPDVPTVGEELGTDVVISAVRGLGLRSDTPPERVEILADAFAEASQDPAFADTLLDEVGFRFEFLSLEEAQALESEREGIVQELYDAGELEDR